MERRPARKSGTPLGGKVTFFFNLKLVLLESELTTPPGRYLITTQGDLHIRDVGKKDENSKMNFPNHYHINETIFRAGQYKCQYRDNLIGKSFFSEDGTVIVTGIEIFFDFWT